MESFFSGVQSRRDAWPPGRRDLHAHILPPPRIAQQLVESYRTVTHDRPGLVPVPAEWMHLTVLHSGPITAISQSELAAIIDRLQEECASIAPHEIVLDRPHVGRVAVECPGSPGAPARALWQMSARIIDEITDRRFPLIPASYYPHLSLAYADGPVENAPLRVTLSDLDTGPVRLPAAEIALVWQAHDGHRITWEPITTIPLSTALPAGP